MRDYDAGQACVIGLAANPLGSAAAAHGSPGNFEAPDAANVGGPAQTEKERPILEKVHKQRKRVATLTARAALMGMVLRQDDGAWGITKGSGAAIPLASLQAAEALVFGCELLREEVDALIGRPAREQGVQA